MSSYKGLLNCSARHYKFISSLQRLRIQEILIIKGGYWSLMSNRENPWIQWYGYIYMFDSSLKYCFPAKKHKINCDCSCTVLVKYEASTNLTVLVEQEILFAYNKAVLWSWERRLENWLNRVAKIIVILLIQETLFSRRSNWLKPTRT